MASSDKVNGFVVRWQSVAVAAMLLLNVGALVWGASKLSSTVEHLAIRTKELSTTIKEIQTTQVEILRRMDVLEDRSERE